MLLFALIKRNLLVRYLLLLPPIRELSPNRPNYTRPASNRSLVPLASFRFCAALATCLPTGKTFEA